MVRMWLFEAWTLLPIILCGAMDELPLECSCCFLGVGDEPPVCYPCSHAYHPDCISLFQIVGSGVPDCPRYREIDTSFVRFVYFRLALNFTLSLLHVDVFFMLKSTLRFHTPVN